MSDVRARVANNRPIRNRPPVAPFTPSYELVAEVLAATPEPVPPIARPPAAIEPTTPAVPEPALIGKKHGRQRSVSLYIPAELARRLRQRAESTGVPLGSVTLDVLNEHHETVRAEHRPAAAEQLAFGPRRQRTPRRGLDDPVTIYVLWTPEEAENVRRFANEVGLTVSAVVTEAGFHAERGTRHPAILDPSVGGPQ